MLVVVDYEIAHVNYTNERTQNYHLVVINSLVIMIMTACILNCHGQDYHNNCPSKMSAL